MTQAAFYEGERQIRIGEGNSVAPQANEVQIKVSHGGICGTDLHIFHGAMDQRVEMPQILGHEMSGTIHAIGNNVAGLSIGDKVTVMPLDPCGDCPACEVGHSHICYRLNFWVLIHRALSRAFGQYQHTPFMFYLNSFHSNMVH